MARWLWHLRRRVGPADLPAGPGHSIVRAPGDLAIRRHDPSRARGAAVLHAADDEVVGEGQAFNADTEAAEHYSRRVFVLTPAGDMLQVYKLRQGDKPIRCMHLIEGRLVLGLPRSGSYVVVSELLVLRGL